VAKQFCRSSYTDCVVCFICIVSEQRVTGIVVFVMVGLSALMADLLKVLPVSVHSVLEVN